MGAIVLGVVAWRERNPKRYHQALNLGCRGHGLTSYAASTPDEVI